MFFVDWEASCGLVSAGGIKSSDGEGSSSDGQGAGEWSRYIPREESRKITTTVSSKIWGGSCLCLCLPGAAYHRITDPLMHVLILLAAFLLFARCISADMQLSYHSPTYILCRKTFASHARGTSKLPLSPRYGAPPHRSARDLCFAWQLFK